MKKDLTNSRLDRQNILNNEMAIEEIQNKSGVEGIVSIEGWIDKYGNVYLIFPIEELSAQIGKCKSSVKTALKELDDAGLLVRRSGGFSKPNHLYVKIPSDEIGVQPVESKAVEKMAVIESEKHPSSGRKNGCAGVGNVAPSKVTEKYKRNKYHEVNYCYG